jgi:pimeloyl-ACP methyl ester carboxylesterase
MNELRNGSASAPITLNAMGSFFFGGRVVHDASGDTFHGDHGYVQYFIPERAREISMIMWHGLGQSGKTWESTPDGREGFWQIFTRRDWPVFIIDQPRRGRAGRAIVDLDQDPTAVIPSMEHESSAWNTFRVGVWQPPSPRGLFDVLQFPRDEESIEQFLRQQTPNTGAEPFPDANHREFLGGEVAKLVEEVGPSVLLTHSHSGQYGWITAMKAPELVKAVVAFEPGEFAFPSDGIPDDVETTSDLLRDFMAPQVVPAEDFQKLTSIPILVVLGDNVSEGPSDDFGIELWRIVKARAKQFVAVVNERGGDATFVDLPEHDIYGNSHFPFADLNNVQIADLVSTFLADRHLDRRAGLLQRDQPAAAGMS